VQREECGHDGRDEREEECGRDESGALGQETREIGGDAGGFVDHDGV
jgi:hypothetical protein